MLAETFGGWKSPGAFERIPDPYEDITPRTEIINTPDKANAIYLAGYSFPLRDDDAEYPAVTISGYMIGGGFLNSKLATRIRQKEGLSYSVRGGFSAGALDRNGGFSASMIYNPANVEKLELAFRDEVEKTAREGFTAEELAAAKAGWLKSRKVGRSTDGDLAGTLNWYLFVGRDLMFDAKREAAVEALTVEQVNTATKKYLDSSKLITVKAGDSRNRRGFLTEAQIREGRPPTWRTVFFVDTLLCLGVREAQLCPYVRSYLEHGNERAGGGVSQGCGFNQGRKRGSRRRSIARLMPCAAHLR